VCASDKNRRLVPVALDLRGYNDSTKEWPKKEHFLERIANDLKNTILELGILFHLFLIHEYSFSMCVDLL
jgi:hypothetical protein